MHHATMTLVAAIALSWPVSALAATHRPATSVSTTATATTRPAPRPRTAPVAAPTFTNLADQASQQQVATLLRQGGIAPDRVGVFLSHVRQFDAAVSQRALVQGWRPLLGRRPLYDPYDLQDQWARKHPTFPGYNCRITAYGLYADLVTVPTTTPARSTLLFMDHDALDADGSALRWPGDRARFDRLFSTVPTATTKDVATHVRHLQAGWRARGIRFSGSPTARLITVVFHDNIGKDQLFVGHTGVLLVGADGKLTFVEKLAFQEPYQVTRFSNRSQLNAYLMEMYDIDETGTMAAPFIMENDSLMPGYHRLRA